jgi:DNA-binding NtrC family response regulator
MDSVQLVGCSQSLTQVEEDIQWAARSDAKVLITGESGVGKEVVARSIHERSNRARQPLVTINCAGIPDTLLASELFGHTRGSFTDAHRERKGYLEQAHRGTVFLDEVGEMSLQMQALLLRFLENGEIQRVGSETRNMRVDVRVLCATNRSLLDNVKAGTFREDLFYRLNVIHIELQPLRQRRDDVPVLMQYFVNHFAALHRMPRPDICEETMAILRGYDWPGNVRELKNVAERIVVRWRGGPITAADLPPAFMFRRVPAEAMQRDAAVAKQASRAQTLFDAMTQHGESFWSAVHVPFKLRDLTRQDLRSLIRIGLSATRGSYRSLVRLFNMPDEDYKRFLNFLRKHDAHLPIHEFRMMPVGRMAVLQKTGTSSEWGA